jgi:cobalt/nickel transport system permease protein
LSAVILIQALFFADGGLLALGCNIFNMGFYACFIAYPMIYRQIIKKSFDPKRITLGAILAVVAGLQLGAFSVVLQTWISGVTELPFASFTALMQPIHLAIGLVEGIATAAVLSFVYQCNPSLLEGADEADFKKRMERKKLITTLLIIALLIGGALSLFASASPDGLEWSMEGVAGTAELEAEGQAYRFAEKIQGITSFLPDYGFKNGTESDTAAGTSVSGIVGGGITLGLACLAGYLINRWKKKVKPNQCQS